MWDNVGGPDDTCGGKTHPSKAHVGQIRPNGPPSSLARSVTIGGRMQKQTTRPRCVRLTRRVSRRVEAAYDRIRERGGEIFDFDRLVQHAVGRVGDGDPDPRHVVELSTELLRQLQDAERRTWRARQVCETAIGIINERDLHQLDMAVGFSQSVFRQLTNNPYDEVPQGVAYAVSTQAVRAHATCHEICALLRAGLANGAFARWRTLHEVNVVAGVLLMGNRHTATRFNSHRWVMLARDLEHADLPDDFWTLPGPPPDVMRTRLVKRYGKSYAHPYGWAAEVTKRYVDEPNPKWHHLEKVAQLAPRHGLRVKAAHHLVHADALGVLHSIDSSGLVHSGASLAGISDTAWQTIDTLAETCSSLLAIWSRYDKSPRVAALIAIADQTLFELDVSFARILARP